MKTLFQSLSLVFLFFLSCNNKSQETAKKKKKKQNKTETEKRDLEVARKRGKEAHVNNENVVDWRVIKTWFVSCILQWNFPKFLNLVINLTGLSFLGSFSRYSVVSIYIQVCSRPRLRDRKQLCNPYNGDSLCHSSHWRLLKGLRFFPNLQIKPNPKKN